MLKKEAGMVLQKGIRGREDEKYYLKVLFWHARKFWSSL